MHLVQIFLPLRDNKGKKLPEKLFTETKALLAEKFGGMTAFTRAPAEGLCKPTRKKTSHDDIVIFEAMVKRLDRRWWQGYRRELERAFRQEKILIHAQRITML